MYKVSVRLFQVSLLAYNQVYIVLQWAAPEIKSYKWLKHLSLGT